MNRRTFAITALALAFSAFVPLSAHDDYRIIGVITKVQPSKLDVKSKGGKNHSIKLNKETFINRDKKKVGATELKPGLSVVVDATGDSESDLLALEIRIVPPVK
jgi:threonine dehydrogenase-like Zn-dependent dehydrogenase